LQTFAIAPVLLALILGTSSCATAGNVREQAIDHVLEMCNLLAEPGIETKGEGEVRFWYESERVNASRQLWNSEGIKAIEARLARTTAGNDEKCLQRALREARNREAE
jgi:hypothetical protein